MSDNGLHATQEASILTFDTLNSYAWDQAGEIASTPLGKLATKGLGSFSSGTIGYAIKTELEDKNSTQATFEVTGELVLGIPVGAGSAKLGMMIGGSIGSAVPVVGTIAGLLEGQCAVILK